MAASPTLGLGDGPRPNVEQNTPAEGLQELRSTRRLQGTQPAGNEPIEHRIGVAAHLRCRSKNVESRPITTNAMRLYFCA